MKREDVAKQVAEACNNPELEGYLNLYLQPVYNAGFVVILAQDDPDRDAVQAHYSTELAKVADDVG